MKGKTSYQKIDITESTNPSDVLFVTKVREQKRLTKCKQYNKCAEYIQNIGIKTKADFFNWRRHGIKTEADFFNRHRHNRGTRIKLGIPSDPQQMYKNHGWTTYQNYFGTQPPVTEDTKLLYTECAKRVQELGISAKPKFKKWCEKNQIGGRDWKFAVNPVKVIKIRVGKLGQLLWERKRCLTK